MRNDFLLFLCLIFAEGCTFKDSGSYVDQSHKFKKTTHKIQDPNYKIPIQNSSMWKGVHLHRQWVRFGGSSETLTPSICVYPALGHNNIDNKCTNTIIQIQTKMKHSPFYLCLSAWARQDQWRMNQYMSKN